MTYGALAFAAAVRVVVGVHDRTSYRGTRAGEVEKEQRDEREADDGRCDSEFA